jgi:hypothetical protein
LPPVERFPVAGAADENWGWPQPASKKDNHFFFKRNLVDLSLLSMESDGGVMLYLQIKIYQQWTNRFNGIMVNVCLVSKTSKNITANKIYE